MKKIIAALIILGISLAPFPSSAEYYFNKNNVLSNYELLDYDSMSLARIQEFLNLRGVLDSYYFEAIGGIPKKPSEIIYDASQYYGLNPKFFLVTLQKEQSLITDSNLNNEQLNEAMGYGCPDYSTCDPAYRGFFNQINQAAKAIIGPKYLQGIEDNGHTISGWGPGITKTTLDGIAVTPDNAATAILYTYTPWVGAYGGGDQRYGGTSIVAKLWQEWFALNYPDGSLLRVAGENGVWLIQKNKKRPILSRAALLANFDEQKIIPVSAASLAAYETGSPIKYPEGALVQSPGGTIYIIVRGERRGLASREVFNKIGYNPEEVINLGWSEINALPEGESITSHSLFPTGTLLQIRESGGIVYLEDGVRHSIWAKEILQSQFKNRLFTQASQKEVEAYPEGEPVKFKDGELVTSKETGAVYVISNGQKRRFDSAETFEALGYRWENIIFTSTRALDIHPTGKTITL